LGSDIVLAGPAAWAPDGTRLAFTRELGLGCLDIFVVNAGGSGEARVTNGPGCTVNSEPTWSPDGTRIAFRSQRGGLTPAVYVMNADGSNQTFVTDAGGGAAGPAWSPDGRTIAFSGGAFSGGALNLDIYTVNPDGSGLTRRTSHPYVDESPDWSPDGSKLVFARRTRDAAGKPTSSIFSMNADGSGETQLVEGGLAVAPAWSPDGQQIAYVFSPQQGSPGAMFVSNLDGTGRACVASRANEPSWQTASAPAPAAIAGQACGAAQAVSVSAPKTQDVSRVGAVTVTTACSTPCAAVTGAGKIAVLRRKFHGRQVVATQRAAAARSVRLKSVTRQAQPGSIKLKLKIPKKALKRLRSDLKHGAKATAKVTVTAKSRSGDVIGAKTIKIALTAKR
jgi:Tol biopolymer transport system component